MEDTGTDFWDIAVARARRIAAAAAGGVVEDEPVLPVGERGSGERIIRPLPPATEYLRGDGVVLYLADDDVDDEMLLDRVEQVARAVVDGMGDARRERFVAAGCPVTLGGFDPALLRASSAWWPVTIYDRQRRTVVALGLR